MLALSSSNFSLFRLYRFRDPDMERHYQADVSERNVFYTRLHFMASFIFRTNNCLMYHISANMPVSFWLHLAGAIVGLVFALSASSHPVFRRNWVVIHFLYCLFCIGILIAAIFAQYVESSSNWDQMFLPTGGHLMSVSPDGTSVVVDQALEAFFRMLSARSAVSTATANAAGLLFFVCLTGLNLYSLACYAICFVGLIVADTVVLHDIASPIYDVASVLTVSTYIVLITVGLEGLRRRKFLAETQLERQMRASETADNILNHMLKNTLADVAGYIELHLQGSIPVSALHDSLACLRRGMRVCKERLAYLKLVGGDYTSVLNPVSLSDFGRQLASGRPIATEFADSTVLMDHVVCGLILENALSNAAKHGRPDNPDIIFAIRLLLVSEDNIATIQFEVTNLVNPGATPLTPEYMGQSFGSGSGERPRRAVFLSDGIGLEHSRLAARLAGITLSLTQNGDRAVFRAEVNAEILGTSRRPSLSHPPLSLPSLPCSSVDLTRCGETEPMGFSDLLTLTFPKRLRFLILDDNGVSRKILSHQIASLCPRAQITEFGDQESDVELFSALAVECADVVVVDQHLDYGEPRLGTDVVRRLRRMGYKGLVCIRSADDSPEDQTQYAASGAHCSIGKDVPGPEMLARIIAAYHDLQGRSDPTPDAL